MLVDASLESNKIENLVLGVGINFDVNAKQIEKTLKETPNFYGVASLKAQNQKIKPILLVQTFLVELEKIYKLLNEKKIKKIVSSENIVKEYGNKQFSKHKEFVGDDSDWACVGNWMWNLFWQVLRPAANCCGCIRGPVTDDSAALHHGVVGCQPG